MTFKIVSLLLFLAAPAMAQLAPKPGEIALDGVVASVARDGSSFRLETSSFTLPNGKSASFKVPKIKVVALNSKSAIFPRGDALWKLPASDLRVGFAAQVVGKDAGSGKPLGAREVELVREIEGKKLDYFVAKNGSDEGKGSFDSPWRTVQGAINRVPNGFEDAPCVVHLGAGDFGESSDGQSGGILIENKGNLILTGKGATSEGTQITTGDFPKKRSGVVRVSRSKGIAFRNLIIGDDKNWEGEAFFEATLHLDAGATVDLKSVILRGPTQDTLLDDDKKRAPTAIHAGTGDWRGEENDCFARLQNVLVTGHGSFLSNPAGRVECERVTIARTFGFFQDDVLLFLQTPRGYLPTDKRFTFKSCLFYELQGRSKGRQVIFSAGEEGQNTAFFDPQSGDGNWIVRCNHQGPNDLYTAQNLADGFPDRNKEGRVRAQGVWPGGDPKSEVLGGLRVNNDLQLTRQGDFVFVSPTGFSSGWTGGIWSPLNP